MGRPPLCPRTQHDDRLSLLGVVLPSHGRLSQTRLAPLPYLGLRPHHLPGTQRLVGGLQHLPPPATGFLHVDSRPNQPLDHPRYGGQLRASSHGHVPRRSHFLRRHLPLPHPAGDRLSTCDRRPTAHPALPLLRLHDGVAQRPRPFRPFDHGAAPHPLRHGTEPAARN